MLQFGGQVQKWRWAKSLTQATLAARAGLSRPNLVDIETGKRECTLKTLRQLANALEISPGKLLDQLPAPTLTLNRYEIDELSRALLGKAHPQTEKLKKLVALLMPLLYPIGRTIGHSPKIRSRKKPWLLKQQANLMLGAITVKQIIRRCNKLATHYV